ncbi:Tad domain-containing protein [Sphingomonas sp. BN140010]|uniref:Tad domain-containing protein n=1 Tax=Sphingomonas arvum TaxID=2992113 RepID=A0ABT3JI32_9SPHN|nr:TadE/TadG family type IV pilus assembly protein [Sphingomonas sp. BN140010]MCW3798646.1 Tad domain-containing protein [Sphingomonas sp. BN140010]
MMGFLKRLRRNQRGNTLILTAAAMPLLIGSAGLATDTIQWALWKRQLQKAADSAAIAGVYARMAGQDATAAVNYDVGYPSQPATGPNNNRTGYTLLNAPAVNTALPTTADYINPVQVTLKMEHTLPFSSMFLTTTPTITASATAAAIETAEYCVTGLVNTNATGITVGGTVKVNLKCPMITNSTSMDAAVAFGNSKVTTTAVAAVGGLDTTDNWGAGTTLLPFTTAQPDPFADVNPPAIPSDCNKPFDDKPGDDQTWPATRPASGIVCVTNWTSQGTVNLQSDTTYIITGNMNVNSKAVVNCARCTFVMTNSTPSETGTVDLNGGATMNLTSPATGPYQGILFYSDRGASTSKTSKINGGSSSIFQGAFYFPHQQLEYTGNSTVSYECVKLVAWTLKFMGNADLENTCPKDLYGDRFKGRQVRLVA